MIRPVGILNEISRLYPQVWKQTQLFLNEKGKGLAEWESWCFLPLAAPYSIVSTSIKKTVLPPDMVRDVSIIGAMAAWRLSQGIYRFDPDLFEALWGTPLNHDLPIDLFFRLPEYCMYIETPGKQTMGKDLHGFFVHLEDDVNDRHVELRLLLDFDDSPHPVPIHLDQEGILKSIEKAQKFSADSIRRASGVELFFNKETAQFQAEEISPLVSLVLYICSTNAELVSKDGRLKPNRAKPKKIKKGLKFFPANKPADWDVGLRTGATLRAARNFSESSSGASTKTGKSVIPHTRKAHWHTYWTGKGRAKPEVKWINMTLVNAEKAGVSPTLHKVKK